MKKMLAILLIVCLLFATALPYSAFAEGNATMYDLTEKTLTMAELDGKYKTQGRTVLQNGGLYTHYTSTGIEFNAYCSGDVSVTFQVDKFQYTTQANIDNYGGCYFTVIVDGVKQARDFCRLTSLGEITVKIAEDLTTGNHTFEIYRQTEIGQAKVCIKSITLGGEVLAAPANRDKFIEFVGASQWGGYGNLLTKDVNDQNGAPPPAVYAEAPLYQDSTQSLTYLTARELNADWSVVSVQGIGAYWGGQNVSMSDIYDYVGYKQDKNTKYDFARQPDYVVIGLGTNDYRNLDKHGKTTDDLVVAFKDFIRLMRQKNPNAKIVWAHGMCATEPTQYVKAAVEELGGAKYGVYEVQLPYNVDGGNNHPSVAGHEAMAEELSTFIKSISDCEFDTDIPTEKEEETETTKVIAQSNFSETDGNVAIFPSSDYVKLLDSNSDGTADYAELTGSGKVGGVSVSAAVASPAFKAVPGMDYEISFEMKVPEDTATYYFLSGGKYYALSPQFALYQPDEAEIENGKVGDRHREGQNEYAYKGKRRDDFVATWNIGNSIYTRSQYSIYDYRHFQEQFGATTKAEETFSDWTKVSLSFTATASAENSGAQTVALCVYLYQNIPGLKLLVRDFKITESNPNSGSGETVGPEFTGDSFYEDFENVEDFTDILTVYSGATKNPSWVLNGSGIVTSDSVSGEKSLALYAMSQDIFIPFQKEKLEENKIYEFSMDWKLNEYLSTKKRQISKLYFVGYNPSEGKALKSSYKAFAFLEELIGTGNWIHTSLLFKSVDFDAYEQFGIYISYGSSTPYTQEEDTLYIDNIALKEVDDPTVKTPLNLNAAPETSKTINVLALGNSFSNDATTFIPQIAKADGVDLRVLDCSIGGCTLICHYINTFNGTTDYSANYRTTQGTIHKSNVSLYQALTAKDWDYITIQQQSNNSGNINSFEPYLAELIKYIKELCPNAKLIFHMTWAFPEENESGLRDYGSQEGMHNKIKEVFLAKSEEYNMPIIPSGEAIKLARDVYDSDFNRDTLHLDDKGRVIAALTWYEFFTGISALKTNFDLQSAIGTVGNTSGANVGITAEEDNNFRNFAHEALKLYGVAAEEGALVKGDIDGLYGVNDADAEYLLMHTFFPEDYPVSQACDFNGDGKVNDADAEHLLMYTFFPEDYPLK